MQDVMIKNIFNTENKGYEVGKYPTFLGEQRGLYDSINVTHREYYDLYKKQKSQDWEENEVSLEQDRIDFETCSKNDFEVMIKTLSWQWEADSAASNSIITAFAPFISNSECYAMMMKQSEIEILHALTYSEIVRQCLKQPKKIFDDIMQNKNITNRSETIIKTFSELKILGAKIILGEVVNEFEVKKCLFKAMTALYALEAIEFIGSFACTFAFAEQDRFMGIAKLVQKIMIDEIVHVEMDKRILNNLKKEWSDVYEIVKPECKEILDAVYRQERDWNEYIFSEGRVILGLNTNILNQWQDWNAFPVYMEMGIKPDFKTPKSNPLQWMDKWMNIDKVQTANQEIQNTNYKLNTLKDDSEGVVYEF